MHVSCHPGDAVAPVAPSLQHLSRRVGPRHVKRCTDQSVSQSLLTRTWSWAERPKRRARVAASGGTQVASARPHACGAPSRSSAFIPRTRNLAPWGAAASNTFSCLKMTRGGARRLQPSGTVTRARRVFCATVTWGRSSRGVGLPAGSAAGMGAIGLVCDAWWHPDSETTCTCGSRAAVCCWELCGAVSELATRGRHRCRSTARRRFRREPVACSLASGSAQVPRERLRCLRVAAAAAVTSA